MTSAEQTRDSIELSYPTTISKLDRTWVGIALCALSGISYGSQALLVKWAYAQNVNTITVLTMRFTVAAIGIWLLVGFVRPNLRLPASKIAGLGVLGLMFIVNAGCYYLSLDMLGAGTAALLGSTFPIWVVIWSVLFLSDRMDKQRLLALTLSLAGCVLTIDPVAVFTSGTEKFSWLGAFLALFGAFSYSFFILLSGKIGKGVSGLVASAYMVPVTAGSFIIIALITGQFMWNMNGLGWLFCIGVGLGAAIAIGTYQAGIQLIGPSRASIVGTTEPATAVLLGILFLSEPTSLVKMSGGALIIAAIILLSRPARSKK